MKFINKASVPLGTYNIQYYNSKATGYIPVGNLGTGGTGGVFNYPNTLDGRTRVFLKRIVNPTPQKVTKMGVMHGDTQLTVVSGTPKIKFAVYRIGTNGRPTTKVEGLEGTITLRTGGTSTYHGIGAILSVPTAFPWLGDFVIAWVTNTNFLTTPSNANFYCNDRLNLGNDSLGMYGDWNEKFDLEATVPTMFADQAAFDAFVFPASFSTLAPSAYTQKTSRNDPACIDWHWRYEVDEVVQL